MASDTWRCLLRKQNGLGIAITLRVLVGWKTLVLAAARFEQMLHSWISIVCGGAVKTLAEKLGQAHCTDDYSQHSHIVCSEPVPFLHSFGANNDDGQMLRTVVHSKRQQSKDRTILT